MDDIQLVMKVDTAPVDRAVRVMDNLEAELRDVERAMDKGLITEKQYNAETVRLSKSMDRLKVAARGSAKDFRTFEKSVYGSGKAMRQKEIAMQQAGYQLQDFIVQVQAGTNPLIAFSQQGSQLAGFFAGPWGAAIGLGIAALGGLGTALLGAKGQAKDLKGELENLMNYVSESEVNMSDLINMSFTGPLEKARREAVAVLGVFKEIESKKLRQSLGESVMPILDLLSSRQDVFNEMRTEKAFTGKVKRTFVRPEAERNQLQQGEIFLANISSLLGDTLKGDADEFGIRLQNIFLKLKDSGYATEEITLAFKELLDQPVIAQQILDTFAARQKKLEEETKARDKAKAEADAKRAAEDLILLNAQAAAEKALLDENAAYEKRIEKENRAAAITRAKEDKILLNAQAKRERDLLDENAKYEAEQDEKRRKEREANFINTLNYQYSLVEETLNDIQSEQDALNDAAEELGKRLGIGFEAALEIIRRAKAEATVGLDAFGGAGDFKYSVPTYFDPNKGKKKGKTPAQELDEYLTKMERRVKLEQKQVGVSEEVARTLELREEYEKRGLKVNNERIEALVKEEEALRKATELQDKHTDRVTQIGDAFSTMLMNVVDGTMKADEAFKSFMSSVLKQLYQEMAIDPAVSFLKSFLADGGVMSRGRLTAFANGGVVNGPTVFPMANGMGLMGEAGPEAIMPLKRGPDGKLGVEGGGGVTVVQNINVSTGVQQTVRTEIKSLMPQIAEASKAAVADAKRRGGSYGRNFA